MRSLAYKAFTVIELLIVVSIIAILSTIGFVYYGQWSSVARDTARVTDIDSIAQNINLSFKESSRYPDPEGRRPISYSGITVWNQGILGPTTAAQGLALSKIPLDTKFGNNYTYSVLSNGTAFQIAGALEGHKSDVAMNSSETAFADSGNITNTDGLTAYVRGNYNSLAAFAFDPTRTKCVFIALPSIILADMPASGTLESAGTGVFVLDKKGNIPYSYKDVLDSSLTGAFQFYDYSLETKVVLGTDCYVPESGTGVAEIAEKLQKVYASSTLAGDPVYQPYLFQNTTSEQAIRSTQEVIQSSYRAKVPLNEEDGMPGYYCAKFPPSVNALATQQWIGAPGGFNQSWTVVGSGNLSNTSCAFACKNIGTESFVWDATANSGVGNCVTTTCGNGVSLPSGAFSAPPQAVPGTAWVYNPSTSSSSGAACTYNCINNPGVEIYTWNGSACKPNDCPTTTLIPVNVTHDYLVPGGMSHSGTTTVSTSTGAAVGVDHYQINFSCLAGVIKSADPATEQTFCQIGYHRVGTDCVEDPCNAGLLVTGNLSHTYTGTYLESQSGTTLTGTFAIPSGKQVFSQDVSCVKGVLSPAGNEVPGVVTCEASPYVYYDLGTNTCKDSRCYGTTTAGGYTTSLLYSGATNVTYKKWVPIANGKVEYGADFACNYGTLAEGPSTPTGGHVCDVNYYWDGDSCEDSRCYSQSKDGYTTPFLLTTKTGNATKNIPTADGHGYRVWTGVFSCFDSVLTTVSDTPSGAVCDAGYGWDGSACMFGLCGATSKSGYNLVMTANGSSTTSPKTTYISHGSRGWNGTFLCTNGSFGPTGEVNTWNSCDGGYTWNGSSCIENNCPAGNYGSYWVTNISASTSAVMYRTQYITHGWISWGQSFACSAGSHYPWGTEFLHDHYCDPGYQWNAGARTCDPMPCPAGARFGAYASYNLPSGVQENTVSITENGVSYKVYTAVWKCNSATWVVVSEGEVRCQTNFTYEGTVCKADCVAQGKTHGQTGTIWHSGSYPISGGTMYYNTNWSCVNGTYTTTNVNDNVSCNEGYSPQ